MMVMIGPAPLFSLSLFLSLDGVEKDLWWRHNDGKEQALLPDVLLHIINIARKHAPGSAEAIVIERC